METWCTEHFSRRHSHRIEKDTEHWKLNLRQLKKMFLFQLHEDADVLGFFFNNIKLIKFIVKESKFSVEIVSIHKKNK